MGAMLFSGPWMAHAPRKAMDGVRGAKQSPDGRATPNRSRNYRLYPSDPAPRCIAPMGRFHAGQSMSSHA